MPRSLLIPRVIHRVWPGEDPLPAELEAYGESWERHHPGWEMKLWRPSDLPPLRNQAHFDSATSYAMRSDIARYELLLRFGGIYVDTDFECLRPFDDLLAGVEAFMGTEDGWFLTNALMGAVPGHPVIEAVVDAIPGSIAANPEGPPNELTGPHLVTAVLDGNPELRERLRVFEPDVFYPYLWNEQYRRGETFTDSYAVHHWAGGWVTDPLPQVPPRYRLVLAADWARPAGVAAVIKPFARLFAPEDPLELVLAVAHEPAAGDVEQAQRLIGGLGIDARSCASITLESFAESSRAPYDLAVVPAGDPDALLLEVGEAVSWLHDTRRFIDRHGRPALASVRGQEVLIGNPADLAGRLGAFRAPASEPAPSRGPAPAPAASHRATYLGEDRLLVSTSWGGKLFMSASDLSLTPEVLHEGNYDHPFTAFLERTLRPGYVAFDIGANVGLFTVLMGRLVGPSGHVLAYEAAPDNVALLRDSVAMNYYGDWVEVVAKAAAAAEGNLQFHVTTRFQGNGSLLPHDDAYNTGYMVDEERVLEVPAEPLDVHRGRFQTIHLVKIDVEGGEEQVLAGMEALIASGAVERICFELLRDRMGADWEPMAARLRALAACGWSLFTLGAHGEPDPIGVEAALADGTFSQLLLVRPGVRAG